MPPLPEATLPADGGCDRPEPGRPHPTARGLVVAALVALLAACASTPPAPTAVRGPAPATERDGPEALPPPNLDKVPDAEPRIEPIRVGGPNKPYEALGRGYVPITDDRPFVERGFGSWYGRKFHGRRTASGETYNMYEMTAAHPTLPIPSYARVRNPANGREVIVRVNDRGPFSPGRIVDLSYTAALKLGLLRGVAPVEVERITFEEIRSGAWRKPPPDTQLASIAAVPANPLTPTPTPTPAAPAATPAPASAATAAPPATPAPPAAASSMPPTDSAGTPPAAAPTEAPRRAYTVAARGYWVQLGAFRDRAGAETLQRQVASELDWLAPLLAVFNEAAVHRVQAGPYPSRSEAGSALVRIQDALKLTPVIVERR
jgi:rare lipoprotein A